MGEYVEGNDVCPKGLENPEDKIKRVRAWVEGRRPPLFFFFITSLVIHMSMRLKYESTSEPLPSLYRARKEHLEWR